MKLANVIQLAEGFVVGSPLPQRLKPVLRMEDFATVNRCATQKPLRDRYVTQITLPSKKRRDQNRCVAKNRRIRTTRMSSFSIACQGSTAIEEGEAPTEGEDDVVVKVPSLPIENSLIVFEP